MRTTAADGIHVWSAERERLVFIPVRASRRIAASAARTCAASSSPLPTGAWPQGRATLVAVAEFGNVARASCALDMMQSAVSKSVAAIEGETSLRLFDRVGRNIGMTATGAAFRGRACELLDHACRLEAWATASRPAYPTAALVRIGVGRSTRGTDPMLGVRIVLPR